MYIESITGSPILQIPYLVPSEQTEFNRCRLPRFPHSTSINYHLPIYSPLLAIGFVLLFHKVLVYTLWERLSMFSLSLFHPLNTGHWSESAQPSFPVGRGGFHHVTGPTMSKPSLRPGRRAWASWMRDSLGPDIQNKGIEDSGEFRCTIKTAPKSYDKIAMTKIQSFIYQIKMQPDLTTRWVVIRLQYLQIWGRQILGFYCWYMQ